MGAQAVRLSNVDIDNALKNKDFEVLFQPIFDLGNGALARMEAFVRWRHPSLGLLPPGAFISFFESQGRMSELTRYVLANAISSYIKWRGPFAPGLSVNLALSDLSDEAFASHFTKLLRDYEFPADLITLECPMPPVDVSMDKAFEHFKRLSDTGARLAIEVRGRANDLLRTLDPFPFDEIKTGGSAILRFARTVRGPGLSAIADLLDVANDANAAITAVGVEDQASLSALRGLGFTAAQGNHLGKVGELTDFRPHRINEVRELLELEPLTSENIAALFRTEAPSLTTTGTASSEAKAQAAQKNEDALLNRLNQRAAQFETAEETDNADAGEEIRQEETEAEKKAKVREKAKALMLAKRSKARDHDKAPVIERAKSGAADISPEMPLRERERGGASAPRELQERLSEAFKPQAKSDQDQHNEEREQQERLVARKSAVAPEQSAAASSAQEAVSTPRQVVQGQSASAASAALSSPSQQQVASGGAGGAPPALKLSVGTASAHFQPGIRVGAPALPAARNNPARPAASKTPTQGEAARRAPKSGPDVAEPGGNLKKAGSGEARSSTVERAMASLAPEDSPIKKPAVSKAPASAQDHAGQSPEDLVGDLHDEDAPMAGQKERKRRKSFLRRTVIPYPTHFWPRSWKRAWRKRNE